MQNNCVELHALANRLPIHSFPYDEHEIPLNGIYLFFEKGEYAHGTNRIVRVGTHTGETQLRTRLKEHFLAKNKDRSIFRKNIGRCLLNKVQDPFIKQWEIDLTSRIARDQYSASIDFDKQSVVEQAVSQYIQTNFSFVTLPVNDKSARLTFESKIISTISLCPLCEPSTQWLGSFSPKKQIRESGLWQVQELYKEPLSNDDLDRLNDFLV